MGQTLRYVNGLIANFPDNTSGLIKAEHIRDFCVSFVNGRGFLVDETNVTIPIQDGTWTQINPLLISPESTVNTLWVFDGNNFGVSNYNAFSDTIVPAGYTKLMSIIVVLDLDKAAGGADNYDVQVTKNNVGIGLAETIEYDASGSQTVTVLASIGADVSLSDTYGVQIRGVGTDDDLTLRYLSYSLSDSILLAEPTP